MSQPEKAAGFRALHEGEPFLIPNPWDAGTAKMLERLGFKALATTSSGFAFTLGRADGQVTLDEVVEHTRLIAEATSLPVSVDLENGYGPPGEAIARIAEAGAAGGSIEDFDGERIYDREEAVERVAEAVEAARATGFVLTARAENFVRDNPDLADTIARLQAYEAAGADVLYAPRLPGIDEVRSVCAAISRPVNVLAHRGLTFDEVVEAGAQRVSVGGQLTWVAAAALSAAAERIRDGDFSVLSARPPEGLGG